MEKNSKEKQYIIDNIDRAINELVYEKTQIIKAYNYYHGKRDPEQFRHLEENYGIGTPTSIEFIPLARNHIDVLIGEYQYIDNAGVEKINTLSAFTTNNLNQTFHAIYIHCIDNFTEPVCDICDPNIKRILGMFHDTNKDVYGSMYMGKTMVGSDEAIRMFLRTESTVPIVDSDGIAIDFQYVGFTIPMGWYTLIKQ